MCFVTKESYKSFATWQASVLQLYYCITTCILASVYSIHYTVYSANVYSASVYRARDDLVDI